MTFLETPLLGAFTINLSPFEDERGRFTRLFCQNELKTIGFDKQIMQINHSLTKQRGTIRGLHFQKPPFSEVKIIRCLKGRVLDVIVDIRRDSPTFLKWFSIELSPEAHNAILVPEGFAHGFQTLKTNSELLYLHTAFYTPNTEGGLRYDDPQLNISWKLPVTQISERDKNHPFITTDFKGI
jgi:dTDP-4-dehydrorhamnose 3,5-epimerase